MSLTIESDFELDLHHDPMASWIAEYTITEGKHLCLKHNMINKMEIGTINNIYVH